MTDSHPKFKFKKRSIKKKRLRRADADDGAVTTDPTDGAAVKVEDDHAAPNKDEGGKEEQPYSALGKILAAERRRKLLGVGRGARGIDAADLGRKAPRRPGAESSEESARAAPRKDPEERLKVDFAGGKLAGSNDMGGDDEGGILAKKHRRAMEDYIAKNLEGGGNGVNGISTGAQPRGSVSKAERDLYAELLTSDAAGDDGGKNAPDAAGEGDVGAGGAMMGGTGIAEVALPVDERIRALKETERAAREHEFARREARLGRTGEGHRVGTPPGGLVAPDKLSAVEDSPTFASMVPTNFAVGPGKRKRKEDIGLLPVAINAPIREPAARFRSAPLHDPPLASTLSSSALPSNSASSAGPSVRHSDVSDLGASYSHNFKLHTDEWVSRRRNERQVEIDAVRAQRDADEGPSEESRARVGFEAARRIARGEVVPPTSGEDIAGGERGPKGESLRNEWDKRGNPHSTDERVWRTFMSKQQNRR